MDMAGNVNEWTNDWHALDYYAESPIYDPPGPDDGFWRVIRGGCFLCFTPRIPARTPGAVPDVQIKNLGFRCAR